MNKKYKNKYRIESVRLKNWDYRNNGAYFITINTANREHFFGEIVNNEMQLSLIGEIADKFWEEIPKHFPNVELGNYIVMPNHTHGILIIDNEKSLHCNDSNNNNQPLMKNNESESLQCNDSTTGNEQNQHYSDISPKPGSISTINRSFKSVVSKHAKFIDVNFKWQSKFHDHIIRNSESFERIQNYIENNPTNWKEDKFYNS